MERNTVPETVPLISMAAGVDADGHKGGSPRRKRYTQCTRCNPCKPCTACISCASYINPLVVVVLVGWFLYGVLIAPAIWYWSYKPLEAEVVRREQWGCLSCTFTTITVTTKYHVGILFYGNWMVRTGDGTGDLPRRRLLDAISSDNFDPINHAAYLDTLYRNRTSCCYIDPQDDIDDDYGVSFDLIDMKASLAPTAARFVATMVFVAMAIVFFVLTCIALVIHGCAYWASRAAQAAHASV